MAIVRATLHFQTVTVVDSLLLLSELLKYSPNSRCRPPSCLIAVFAVFFLSFRPGPAAVLTLETSEMSAIFFHISKKMKFERSQIHIIFAVMVAA